MINEIIPAKKILFLKNRQAVYCEKAFFCSNSWNAPGYGFPRTGMFGTNLKHPAFNSNAQFLRKLHRSAKRIIRKSQRPENYKQLSKNQKIFVSRKSRFRRFTNQDSIEAIFKANGFKVIYLEELSPPIQLMTFRNSPFIASFHGTNLSNLIAARSGTVILEIFGKEGSDAYAKITKTMDLKYNHLNILDNNKTDLTANLKLLEDRLSSFESISY